jgi:hypothetical protein
MTYIFRVIAVVLLSCLAACGGGGSGAESNSSSVADPSVNTSVGYWTGTSSTGTTMNLAILESGESFGVYTTTAGSNITGAVYGQSNGLGSAFTGTGSDYNFVTGVSTPGGFTGTVAAKASINAATFAGFNVNLQYKPDYDTVATLANVAGTYFIIGRSGRNIILPNYVTVNPQGVFTNLETGCTRTGTLVPHPSGKNIYSLTVTVRGTTCTSFPDGTVLTGVLYLDKAAIPNRFYSLVLKSDKSDAMVIVGTKQ